MNRVADAFRKTGMAEKSDWGMSTALSEIGEILDSQSQDWDRKITYYQGITDNWRASYVVDILKAAKAVSADIFSAGGGQNG